MVKLREIMQKHLQLLLSNKHYALLCTLLLALFPYTAWLAVVVVAFITLRKGWIDGAMLLIPVAGVYFCCSLILMSSISALINMLALFVPCYIAACVLRVTTSWQAVVSVFFFLTALIAIFVQLLSPELVIAQYVYLENFLKETQADASIVKLLDELSNINQAVIASYAFGLQMLSVAFSSIMSLMLARAMQSRLFNVGGFKHEILHFRANKIGILILVSLLFASTQQSLISMMLLPIVVIYFLLAGLSVSANMLDKKSSRLLLLLVIPLVLVPFVTVPFYSVLGLFDSLFNLRLCKLKPRNRG